jgi:hypothetical protein
LFDKKTGMTMDEQKEKNKYVPVEFNGEAEKDNKPKGKNIPEKGKHHKLKSLKELDEIIIGLEARLEADKEGIIDNLKPSHIFASLLPKSFRRRDWERKKYSVDDYLKSIANKHITVKKPETLLDKVKKFILERDGSEL